MRLENLRPFIIPLLLTQLAFAQTPTIGGIELFGAPAAIIEKVRQSLEIKIGDPIPKSKVELEDQIATAGNIARASVTAICCVESKAILYTKFRIQFNLLILFPDWTVVMKKVLDLPMKL